MARGPQTRHALALLIGLSLFPLPVIGQDVVQEEREAMFYRYLALPSLLAGGSIQPIWLADGSTFWYAEGAPESIVFYRVDPEANTRTEFFDRDRLREALAPHLGEESLRDGLPFQEFEFTDDTESAVEFAVGDQEFVLQLDTYAIRPAPFLSEDEKSRLTPRVVREWRWGWPDVKEPRSPDGQWYLGIEAHNLRIRSASDGSSALLTSDGAPDYEWEVGGEWGIGLPRWSPDGRELAIGRVDLRGVPQIPVSFWLTPREEVEWLHVSKPGEPVPQHELFIVDISSRQRVRVDIGEEPDQRLHIIGWRPDGSELLFTRENRTRRRIELLAADPSTGSTRVVLTEKGRGRFVSFVEDGKRLIWMSERDGWNHLYLYELDGALVRRISGGAYPVLGEAHMWVPQAGVVALDEENGWVYFRARGERQRPYNVHLYRVKLDGTGLEQLTDQPGWHDVQFAPSERFFLDTHSSLDRAPVVELRRADGTLLRTLSRSNLDALREELNWRPPEEFAVKAADGKTDLYGVLYKPFDFDPDETYPVIEYIYAGSWTTAVPRRFTDHSGVVAQALAQLGAVVFIVDGRGTPGRGREFQDVVLGSLGRHEIPDHVATLGQLARDRPYMDTTRVGVFGGSWGGYFALRAMLLAPELFRVGVSYVPAPDIGDYYAEYIEPVMGMPANDPAGYDYGSNTRLAENLEGELLLIHGTADPEAPFSGTMKMVDALLRAGKDFDLIVLPDEHHRVLRGRYRGYVLEAVRQHFQDHLIR